MNAPLLSNNPPANVHPLHERLIEQYGDFDAALAELQLLSPEEAKEIAKGERKPAQRAADLDLAFTARTPASIESEEDLQGVTSFVKQIRDHVKVLEAMRVGEKAEYDQMASICHTFFKRLTEKLDRDMKALLARSTVYQQRKADEERRKREEEARKAREAAEAAAAEARRVAEEQARLAREAEEKRQREEEEEAERQRKAAEEAAAKVQTEEDLQAAIEDERKRRADLRAKRLKELQEEEEAEERRLQAEREAQEAAQKAADEAARKAREAAASTADLVRTRGIAGGTSTMRTKIEFEIDYDCVDLEALRTFIKQDHIDQAVRAFMGSKKSLDLPANQPLTGVRFFRSQTAMVA